MPKLIELVGKNLARIREEKGFTQESLAKATGLTRVTIARYESGDGGLEGRTIALIASKLDCEESDLVADAGSRESDAEWQAVKRALLEQRPLPAEWRRVVDAFPSLEKREADWLITLLEERRAAAAGRKSTHPLLETREPSAQHRKKKG